MIRAPIPGRRRTITTTAPLPLFAWAARHATPLRPTAPAARIVLLDTARTPDGEPRPALMIPGRRLPVAYPTLATALAAKRALEAAR